MATVKPVDNVGITFANIVTGFGRLHGVFNVQLGAFQFTNVDGNVDTDLVLVSRLRLDERCAEQLRDILDDLLTAQRAEKASELRQNGADSHEASSKVN